MKSIAIITDKRFLGILSDVKSELLDVFGDSLRQLILYGSYARSEEHFDSDIDIMILVEESDTALRKYNDRIASVMTQLSLKYDRMISLTDESYGRFVKYNDILPFFRNVENDGIEIYGRQTAWFNPLSVTKSRAGEGVRPEWYEDKAKYYRNQNKYPGKYRYFMQDRVGTAIYRVLGA